MVQKFPSVDSSASKTRTGVGGIAVIFTSAMAAIIALILNKSSFSEDAFLLTLIAILASGAGATLYIFSYGIAERILKTAAKTEKHSIELLHNNRELYTLLEKQRRVLDKALPLKNDADEEVGS